MFTHVVSPSVDVSDVGVERGLNGAVAAVFASSVLDELPAILVGELKARAVGAALDRLVRRCPAQQGLVVMKSGRRRIGAGAHELVQVLTVDLGGEGGARPECCSGTAHSGRRVS